MFKANQNIHDLLSCMQYFFLNNSLSVTLINQIVGEICTHRHLEINPIK